MVIELKYNPPKTAPSGSEAKTAPPTPSSSSTSVECTTATRGVDVNYTPPRVESPGKHAPTIESHGVKYAPPTNEPALKHSTIVPIPTNAPARTNSPGGARTNSPNITTAPARLRVRHFSPDSSTVACKEEQDSGSESDYNVKECQAYNIKECPYCKFLVVCKTESSFEDHLLICPVYRTLRSLVLKTPKMEES